MTSILNITKWHNSFKGVGGAKFLVCLVLCIPSDYAH